EIVPRRDHCLDECRPRLASTQAKAMPRGPDRAPWADFTHAAVFLTNRLSSSFQSRRRQFVTGLQLRARREAHSSIGPSGRAAIFAQALISQSTLFLRRPRPTEFR